MRELVSILMPVFKDGQTLKAAIDSCLAQTYEPIELIVLNNGSPDNTADVLRDYSDPRLRVLEQPCNVGIAPARNMLLREARGAFIAWLDADDTMLPERIEKQMDYMRAHPETDILGGWILTDDPELPEKKLPLTHAEICTCLWFKNSMIQPSVLSRNFYVTEGVFYDENYLNSVEDYELWYRLRNRKQFANQPEYLTIYHMTLGTGLGLKKRSNGFEQNLQKLWEIKWNEVPFEMSDADRVLFQSFLYNNRKLSEAQTVSLQHTLNKLEQWQSDPFFRSLLSLHRIRVWRNLPWQLKLSHIALLRHLKAIPELKRKFVL